MPDLRFSGLCSKSKADRRGKVIGAIAAHVQAFTKKVVNNNKKEVPVKLDRGGISFSNLHCLLLFRPTRPAGFRLHHPKCS